MRGLEVFVLDTNVLLFAPEALEAFSEAEVVIPINVIEELDRFKAELSDRGGSARVVSQRLDELRELGSLAQGVQLDEGGRVRVELQVPAQEDLPGQLDINRASNRVLAVAWELFQRDLPVTLVTQDTNLRVKANALEVPVMRYMNSASGANGFFEGMKILEVEKELIHQLLLQDFIDPSELNEEFQGLDDFLPNEGLHLMNGSSNSEDLLAIYHEGEKNFQILERLDNVWGLKPRNPEQRLALEYLLDPEIHVVSLSGKSGTGKTLLALAAGLQLMLTQNLYTRMLVSRPVFPMGRDLGYLPGDAQEKLAPWMQPIFDNLELLIGNPKTGRRHSTSGYQELIERGLLVVEPLTYIRGRSIPNQYLLVDESQNLTPHEMKTIITRAGEGTKIVLTGDPHQIDNPYVNENSNGLSNLVNRFKNHPLAAHINLVQGERSRLAELAANAL